MKSQVKNKSNKVDSNTKPKVKTETPLAEKDEVKQAEDKQRKKR